MTAVTGKREGAKNRVATTATTWTARDPYSRPRRQPALERGGAKPVAKAGPGRSLGLAAAFGGD